MTASGPTEEYLEVSGGRVHVLRGGTGAPLLFLHAAGGAGRWLEYHELLSRRFEVIAPDHPGFGGSDELPEVEGMDDLVYHYLDLIDRLGLDRPHVVGGSFGGWLAAELAVHTPQAVGSMVLLSAAGLRLPAHPVADLFLMTPEQVVDVLFHDVTKASAAFPPDPDVDAILAIYRDMTALARFSWVPFMCNPKLERRLGRISAPTLVVWPAQDKLIPIAHGERYAEKIPNAWLAVVEDCGHAMYFERPTEFARLTADFLATGAELSGASR
ncbi:MAG TPA: alpha/beta fold hydrolase [Actinophytocola sp.]|uniref:alpha/beta fold hydrolase n=1 Tax=Actinophytocola sp. TaxID=1872138 RepID=UPI002DB9132F|nr:alpha/beta fold hydrolase [Actinophytocola sp.]HEU5470239.1 alpha/beta fold hydrolase [Actinophytocola sp.]